MSSLRGSSSHVIPAQADFWFVVIFCTPNLAGWEKSCNFAGRNKSGISYDLPKVRAVAYRFSTTYLLHSAATLRVEIGMREHRQQDSLDFRSFCFLFHPLADL